VLDEGYITDSEGRKVDFKSTIIIMTSNVGSATNIRQREIGYITNSADKTPMTESFHRALERHFAPEFLNRIDEIVLFNELSAAEAQQIVNLELNAIISRLKKLGYNLHITPQAKEYIVKNGFDKKYGARSIKRTITRLIEHPISQMIVDNSITKHLNITISCKDNRLSISQ
jgi:ATP-dependent Clp protease ATP-binding subunit ClpC